MERWIGRHYDARAHQAMDKDIEISTDAGCGCNLVALQAA